MQILLFGTGCDSCRALAERIEEAIRLCDYEIAFEKSSDLQRMLSYGIKSTPGIVLEGKILWIGEKPSVEEIIQAFHIAAHSC